MTTTMKWIPVSGSTHGRGIKITASATPGTTIHTASAVTADGSCDLIEVTVYNSDTVDRTVSFECGGTTAPDDIRGGSVPSKEERTFGPFLLRNALVLKAFGSAANVLTAHGRYRQVVFA